MICRCLQKRNKTLKHYYKSKLFLREKLSVENILKTLINFDIFKKIAMDDQQYLMFKNIPKQNLKRLKDLEKYNINDSNIFKNINPLNDDNNNIRKRILDFY